MYLFQKVKDFKEIYCRKIVTTQKSICKKVILNAQIEAGTLMILMQLVNI